MWLREVVAKGLEVHTGVNAFLHNSKSKFQVVNIAETPAWGKCLVIDEHIQSAEVDEFIYHESLVHPILLSHPNPKRVLICGGGEGATAREVLRHKAVEKVTMCDIDEIVCTTSKNHLKFHHAGSFDNSRFELIIDDARKYLENAPDGSFDVVILDLCDPVPDTPAYLLYTKEFYSTIRQKLTNGGVVVTQAGPAGKLSQHEVFLPIHETFKQAFPAVCPYIIHVPSFMDLYGFVCASTEANNLPNALDTSKIDDLIEKNIDGSHEVINHAIQEGTKPTGSNLLRFYDGITHSRITLLPKWMRVALAQPQEAITDTNPKSIF